MAPAGKKGEKSPEEAFNESELRYQSLFENLNEGILIADGGSGKIVHVNPAICRILGYSAEEFRSMDITGIHPKEDLDHVLSEFRSLASGKTTIAKNIPCLRKDGGIRIMDITSSTMTMHGRPFLVGLFSDVTEQKCTEATLRNFNKKLQQGIEERTARIRESELRHRMLFETSRDAIMTLEPPDWRFTSGNPATIEMFRAKDEAEFTSEGPWNLSPENQPDGRPSMEKAKEQIEKAVREGSNFFEWTHKRLDGQDFPATVLLTCFEWKGTRILQATVRDITESKRAETNLKASLDEKVLLLREIHHRVKNNLQIIISLVNLQMRQIDDERLKQVMAETQNRVRAMAFVHEKLYHSEDIAHIDLATYTRLLVSHLFSFYNVNSEQVTTKIDIGKIMLSINTTIPLGLIINELVSNALKHAFPNQRQGSVSITARKEGETLYLSVKDNGAGIPEDFDWRTAQSLGLRLVLSLVEQLDGTIELDRNGGTMFTIVVKEKE